MIVKIILVVTLIKVCASVASSDPKPQSHHAISSQSFVRHDVPLAYKHTSVHVYSTPKPDHYGHLPHVPHRTPQPSKIIQYAPIYNDQADQNRIAHNPYRNEVDGSTENLNVLSLVKTHLEPRPQELENVQHQPQHLPFIPGYNVELLQTVNRYPGHNAVYRSYPNMSPNEKINKVNYLNQYVLYQNPEEHPTAITTVSHSTANRPEQATPTLSPFVPKQHLPRTEQKPVLYNSTHIAEVKILPSQQSFSNIQQLIPHPKAHRMLLNIARTYNIAELPAKARSSRTMLKNVPSHNQAIIYIPNPADVNRNTRLLPIQNKIMNKLQHRFD